MTHWMFAGLEKGVSNEYLFDTPEKVLSMICTALEIEPELIKSNCRKLECIIPRQLYCYFARMMTVASFEEIGKVINKSHSNVLQACRKVKNNIEAKDKVTIYYFEIIEMLISCK